MVDRSNLDNADYPALYQSASSSSKAAQSQYLLLVRSEYALLIIASVVSLLANQTPYLNVIYAVAIAAAAAIMGVLGIQKPERDWYSCRALAESVKTAAWRYMMRAHPFDGSAEDVRLQFAKFLADILRANSHIKGPLSKKPVSGDEISVAMDKIRGSSLVDRINFYERARIVEQQRWYFRRAKENRVGFRAWMTLCILVQGAAILFAILRLRYEALTAIWPMDPLLVVVAAIIAWIQIKKFNELAAAYNLTAHEIGIIKARIVPMDEQHFSDFVNDTELAFSREHTQWIARQDAAQAL